MCVGPINKGFLKTTKSNYFGSLTLKAVKLYQASIKLSPTGFVGALTREKINSEISSSKLKLPTQALPLNISSDSTNGNNATNSPSYGVGLIMPDGTKILSPLRNIFLRDGTMLSYQSLGLNSLRNLENVIKMYTSMQYSHQI